jgi:hypothetical protein
VKTDQIEKQRSINYFTLTLARLGGGAGDFDNKQSNDLGFVGVSAFSDFESSFFTVDGLSFTVEVFGFSVGALAEFVGSRKLSILT